jgi:M6 family metalloprotease-like protein
MCIICVSTISIATLLAPTHPTTQTPIQPIAIVEKKPAQEFYSTKKSEYRFTNRSCSKSELNKVKGNSTCLKNGKVYRWATKKNDPKPTTRTEPYSSLSPDSVYREIDSCKLINGSSNRRVNQSFEQNPYRVSSLKPIKGLIFPIDFPDLVANSSPQSDFKLITEQITKYYEDMSDGRVRMTWEIYPSYVRFQQNVSELQLGARDASGYGAFSSRAQTLAKQNTELNNYSFVVYAPPPKTSRGQIAIGPAFVATDASSVNATMLDGQAYSQSFPYLMTAHEIGHLMGAADLYNIEAASEAAASLSPYELTYKMYAYMGVFDLMNYAIGPGLELTAWNRWIMDLISDLQMRCIPDQITFTKLSPLSIYGGIKGAVIPISKVEALVLESRRAVRFDSRLDNRSEGVLVYRVNTSIASGQGPMRIQRKEKSTDPLFRDNALKLGESMQLDGFRITVIESGGFGDVVKVEKIT